MAGIPKPIAAAAAAKLAALASARITRAMLPPIPAPPQYSIVYDGGAGFDPGNTDAQSVGQYADTNTNTVHTTRGFTKRAIAQDVGQIFASNVLTPGDRIYFSKLLGTDPSRWENVHGANPQGGAGVTGDEAFADYYALAATGGLRPNQQLAWGDVSIDPSKIRPFAAALARLGRRRQLPSYRAQGG